MYLQMTSALSADPAGRLNRDFNFTNVTASRAIQLPIVDVDPLTIDTSIPPEGFREGAIIYNKRDRNAYINVIESTTLVREWIVLGGASVFMALPPAAVGQCATPPIAFVGDMDTGIASEAANQVDIAAGGACQLSINATTVTVPTNSVAITAGTLSVPGADIISDATQGTADPSITFTGDLDTGIGRGGADLLELVSGGVAVAIADASGAPGTETLNLVNHVSFTQPSLAFVGDADTGIGSSAANTLEVITGGTSMGTIDTTNMAVRNALVQSSTSAANMVDADFVATAAQMLNGFFNSTAALTTNRLFTTASAATIVAAVPANQRRIGAHFDIVLDNTQGGAFTRTATAGAGVTAQGNNLTVQQNETGVFRVVIINVSGGTEAATIHQITGDGAISTPTSFSSLITFTAAVTQPLTVTGTRSMDSSAPGLNQVTIVVQGAGLLNATATALWVSGAPFPIAFRPPVGMKNVVTVTNNAVDVFGTMLISTAGFITFATDASGTGTFTSGGLMGLSPSESVSMSYNVL